MVLSRRLLAGLIVTALLTMSVLAAAPVLADSAGAGASTEGRNGKGTDCPIKRYAGSALHVSAGTATYDTEILSMELGAGTYSFDLPCIKPGTSERVESFFDVFFDITYHRQQETGSFQVTSFFDVFFDMKPMDPTTGAGAKGRGQLAGAIPRTTFTTRSGVTLQISSFFDVFAELTTGGGGGGSFTVSSFFDVFFDITAPMPGGLLLSYAESGRSVNTGDFTGGGGGGRARTDSFFDVFADITSVPGGIGVAYVDSFFDVFFDVSQKPGGKRGGRTGGGLPDDFRARSQHRTSADWNSTGDLLADIRHGAAETASLMIEGSGQKVRTVERSHWKGAAALGESELMGFSFFDVFLNVWRSPRVSHAPFAMASALDTEYQLRADAWTVHHDTAMAAIRNIK